MNVTANLVCRARTMDRIIRKYAPACTLVLLLAATGVFAQADPRLAEADRLNPQYVALYQEGKFREALPLAQRELGLLEAALGINHPDTAASLNNLGLLLREMGDLASAKPYLERALAIREEVLGPQHPNIATRHHELGSLLREVGDLAGAKPHLERALTIREQVLGSRHPATAQSLSFLGLLLMDMGNYEDAKLHLGRALAITEEGLGPKHPYTAMSLRNLGRLLQDMGDLAAAKPYYERALAIREEVLGPKHPNTATSLDNLGTLLQDMGDLAGAKPYLERALAIHEEVLGPKHESTAMDLNNLGVLLQDMGDLAGAKPYLERALAIHEEVLGPQHPDTATSLNNIGSLLQDMGYLGDAKPYYERALSIREEVLGPKHSDTAVSLSNLGLLLRAMGDLAGAKPYLERALAILEEVLGPQHPDTATSLNNLGRLLQDMGDLVAAKLYYERALAISLPVGEPQMLNIVEGNYASVLAETDRPAEAVFFGKQSVNRIQGMRASMTSLGTELQRTFARSKQGSYTWLADLLIEQGRLPEAQQVLAMLKEEEYYDFIRRDGDSDVRQTRATLSPLEASGAERLARAVQPLTAIAEELRELERIKAGDRSETQWQQIRALRERIIAADQAFMAALNELQAAFAATDDSERREALVVKLIDQNRRGLVADLGERVALLQYLVLEEKLYVLMTTADTVQAHTIELPEADLNRLVQQLQAGLRSAGGEVEAPAQALYEYLIEPVAADLAAMNAETVMVSLDGTLRYVPFGVLYDGERYLVERYALAVFNEAAAETVSRKPNPDWYVAGLGVSKAHPGFAALASVPAELEGIVRRADDDADGVIEGVVWLDDEFTEQTFQGLLPDYSVVHIASHFKFQPGNEADSFLLLGDGSHLNLATIRNGGWNFSRVELLTLSACETAVASARARGGEIEGFGTLVQKRGARSVLATLWSVADASTGRFMQTMYRLKSDQPELNKAEAIRQVQLAFLRGDVHGDAGGTERRPIRFGAAANAASDSADWSHPYYWAPFILMGNWL